MAEPRQTLNVAMIGHGFIGKVHSNAFHQVGHFFQTPFQPRLKVICGRDRQKLEAVASQWGWEEIATDWRAVVDRKDIQVVDIAVPNALHAPIAMAAAAAGKTVLCEKPLAMSLDEAERMATAVRGLPNLVWFNYRRVPAVAFAKILLSEGHVGQVFHYRALYLNQSGSDPTKASGWRYRRAVAGSGAMGDLLSHAVDLALDLNGKITELTAMTKTFVPARDLDDAVVVMVRFANGSIGSFEASRFAPGSRNRNSFEINGSEGTLRFNLEKLNNLEIFDAKEPANLQGIRNLLVTGPNHPYAENFWKPGHIIGYEHSFIATLGDFLGALASNEMFHPNFEDALAVQRVLDAVQRSADSKHWVRLEG